MSCSGCGGQVRREQLKRKVEIARQTAKQNAPVLEFVIVTGNIMDFFRSRLNPAKRYVIGDKDVFTEHWNEPLVKSGDNWLLSHEILSGLAVLEGNDLTKLISEADLKVVVLTPTEPKKA